MPEPYRRVLPEREDRVLKQVRYELRNLGDGIQTPGSTIQSGAVTYEKIQDVAADRILGRLSTLGDVQELTAAQIVALLQAEGWTFSGNVQFDGDVGFYGTTPVAQQADISDASTAHALDVVYSDTQVEAALDALGTKINAILDVLDNLGLTA